MIHFTPQSIDALKNGFQFISKNSESMCAMLYCPEMQMTMKLFPIAEIEQFIPKTYRYPGYPLYDLFDKDYLLNGKIHYNSLTSMHWEKHMNDDDILVRINKKPYLSFVFSQSVLPERFKQAIKIIQTGLSVKEMMVYFPDKSPIDADYIIRSILAGDKGYKKETEHLLKAIKA